MNQTRLNLKLVLWTLGVVLVFGLGVHFLHGFQVTRHAQALKAQAESAEEREDLKKAASCWGRYLVFVPDDIDVRARYVMILDRLALSNRARLDVCALYEKVLAKAPGRADVRGKLAALAMRLGLYADARKHLEILVQARPRPGGLDELLGECREAQGEYPQAAASYEEAVRDSPEQLSAYIRLAGVYRHRLYRPERGDEVMDAMVKNNPRSHEALLERSFYRSRNGFVVEAAEDVARAEKISPQNATVLLTAARLAEHKGDLDAARGFWKRGVTCHPAHWQMYLGLADLEARAGRNHVAVSVLKSGVKSLPGNVDLRSALADALIRERDFSQSGALIEGLRKRKGAELLADYLDARALMEKKEWRAAARVLEGLAGKADASSSLSSRAFVELGTCYEAMAEGDRALAAFEKAVATDPSSSAAQAKRSVALLARGQVDDACKALGALTRSSPAAPEIWTLYARASIQRCLGSAPGERDWQEIGEILDRARQFASQEAPVAILRADVLVAQNENARAKAVLEAARDKHPQDASLWIALANLATRPGTPERGSEILLEARRRLGARLLLCLAQIEQARLRGEKEARALLAAAEKDLDRLSPEEQVELRLQLAEAHRQHGNVRDAERLCRRLLQHDSTDLRGLILLFEVKRQAGQEKAARNVLADIRRVEGEAGTWWRYGEALLLLANGKDKLAGARQLVKEIRDSRPGWSRVPLLLAVLERIEGRPERSLEHYLTAIRLGERQPDVLYGVARMLADRGRYDEADRVVMVLEQQGILSAGYARLAAEIALQAHKDERALALARQAVSSTSTDYRDHVWLGELLAAAHRDTEAEDELRLALDLGSSNADAWVALVRFLSETDQIEKAEAAVNQVSAQVPSKRLPLALAQCYEALGKESNAAEHYQTAVGMKPNDFVVLAKAAHFYLRAERAAQAESHLRGLLNSEGFVPADTLAWARREMAVLLMAGDAGKEKVALALIDQNRRGEDEAVADRRARAFVRAFKVSQRRQSLRELEATLNLQILTPEDKYRLAKLYEAEKDWPKAQAQILSLLETSRRNPVYLAHYVGTLIQRGELEAARVWFARLERIEPSSPRANDLRARLKTPE